MVPDEKLSSRKGVVLGNWKLLRSITYNDWKLFDLEKDPGEKVNLETTNPAKFNELKAVLEKFMAEGLSQSSPPNP